MLHQRADEFLQVGLLYGLRGVSFGLYVYGVKAELVFLYYAVYAVVVLSRNHYGIDCGRLAVGILDGNLSLSVRTQIFQNVTLRESCRCNIRLPHETSTSESAD